MNKELTIQQVATLDNLMLAWHRVYRATSGEAKDRLALRFFNMSLMANIRLISDKLQNATYEPSPPRKIHLPKRSGTLRVISGLSITDRIVYQAICNLLTRAAAPDLARVADKSVFAHLPTEPDSLFPIRKWREQYRRFNLALDRLWSEGNRYLVKADVASFYDSVQHTILDAQLERLGVKSDVRELLRHMLRRWSINEAGITPEQGIPQGHPASDLLSTIYLLPLDLTMIGRGYTGRYLRYVMISGCSSKTEAPR